MSQMERLYFFHQRVKDGMFPNTRTIMERFEVSESTARRDINYLRDFLLAPWNTTGRRMGGIILRMASSSPLKRPTM